MSLSLFGKTILITGGTSRLGREFVLAALEAGARIFFTYLKNESMARELEAKGAKAFRLDLASVAAMDEFVKNFKDAADSLDVLIHNAADVRDHTLQNMTEEEWDYVMAVDLKAPYYLTKKLLPYFLKKDGKSRKIFMITSRAAVVGAVGVANYAAAKAGLIGLTKSLAQELGKRNVLVNAVNPGFMKSSMTANMPEEAIQRNLEASPLGRHSEPQEVAGFLAYLSSDAMAQVTGQVFHFESRKT